MKRERAIERAGIGSVGRAMEAAEWALTDYVQKEKALLAFEVRRRPSPDAGYASNAQASVQHAGQDLREARKTWPKGDGLVDMVDLLNPIERVLLRAGSWKQWTPMPPLAYDGYKGGAEHVAPVDFSEDAVAYHAERGRSVLVMALRAAFLLGIEQGKRMERARQSLDGLLTRSRIR